MNRRDFFKFAGLTSIFATIGGVLLKNLPFTATPKSITRSTTYRETNRVILDNIKREIEKTINVHFFSPNDEYTRHQIKLTVSNILDRYLYKNQISNYFVVCDETNNPPHIIESKSIVVVATLQFRMSVEYTVLECRLG